MKLSGHEGCEKGTPSNHQGYELGGEFWEYTNRYCLVRKQMLLRSRTRINIRAGRPVQYWKEKAESETIEDVRKQQWPHISIQLFVPQRDQRIDFRGAARWKVTRKQCHAR